MNEDNTMDLLDLDDGTSMDALPEATPFATPRPKKPWLLLGIGLLIIVLATYIIVRTIGSDDSSTVDVNLDVPPVMIDGGDGMPMDTNSNLDRPDVMPTPSDDMRMPSVVGGGAPVPPPAPQPQQVVQPAPQPVVQPKPQPVAAPDAGGVPTRVIEDRQAVTFNPDKPATTKPRPAAKPATTTKAETKPAVTSRAAWYVQFGSYSTRALAESAQRQIRSAHQSLFQGKQFVILAAQMPTGQTVYRLRVAFGTSGDANSFCRNAKSDGLDCYVAK